MAIKKLQNNFTTPDQSKRLLELGVPANSADLYSSLGFENLIWVRNTHSELREDFFDTLINGKSANTPIWSVGRLIEIYIITRGLDSAYFPIENGEDMVKYLIRLYEERVKDLDFSKLEE